MKIKSNQYLRNFDWLLLIIIGSVVCFSLVLIANAGFNPFSSGEQSGLFDVLSRINFNYVFLQASWFLLGLVLMTLVAMMDYHTVSRAGKIIYIINVTILILLLIGGKTTRGIKAWIEFGDRALQPGELCKITIIIYIGKLIAKKSDEKGGAPLTFSDLLVPTIYFAIPFALVCAQPDFGTAMVFVASFLGMLITAGIDKKVVIIGLIIVAVAIPVAWLLMAGWQKERIVKMFSEEGVAQVEQSKTLIGSGRFLGKGLFREGTLSSLNFMSEQHTDFIFAMAVETTGFLGGLVIIVLYFVMLFRLLLDSKKSSDTYGTMIVMGVMFMLIAHIFENIAMTMGIMPVTGIPAPFLSYGGSSMFTNMIALGLVQSVVMRRNKPYYDKL